MGQFSPDLNFNPQPARPILDKVPHDYQGEGDVISEDIFDLVKSPNKTNEND